MVKCVQHQFGARAGLRFTAHENLIAAIDQGHIQGLFDARQMRAISTVKLWEQTIIVKFENQFGAGIISGRHRLINGAAQDATSLCPRIDIITII